MPCCSPSSQRTTPRDVLCAVLEHVLDWLGISIEKAYSPCRFVVFRDFAILSSHHSRDPVLLQCISQSIMTMMEKESWRCGWCWRLCKYNFNRCPHCGGFWPDRDQTYAPQAPPNSPRVRHPQPQWEFFNLMGREWRLGPMRIPMAASAHTTTEVHVGVKKARKVRKAKA